MHEYGGVAGGEPPCDADHGPRWASFSWFRCRWPSSCQPGLNETQTSGTGALRLRNFVEPVIRFRAPIRTKHATRVAPVSERSHAAAAGCSIALPRMPPKPIRAIMMAFVLWAAVLAPSALSARQTDYRVEDLAGAWLVEQPNSPGAKPYPTLMTLEMRDGVLGGTIDGATETLVSKVTVQGEVAHIQFDDGGSPSTIVVRLSRDRMTFKPESITFRRLSSAETAQLRAQISALMIKPKLPVLVDLPSNGLAMTPPMGWNSWNKFGLKIDEKTVRQIADAIASSGLRDVGYRYVIIDDGWQGERDAQGVLHPNAKFPDMKALAEYVHSRGLKFGIYSSPGRRTCGGFEGSFGYEELDARMYATWGVDYLKYDLCSGSLIYRTQPEIRAAYQIMAQALRSTGRPITFALCEYGLFNVGEWGSKAGGNLWRTSGDIEDKWSSMIKNGVHNDGDPRDAGPGHWNDPDMLEIGNEGMTQEEYRSHMTMWAMLASPLLLGNDVRALSPATLATLSNRAVIAVDQDPLGVQARLVETDKGVWTWTRPLSAGRTAVALVNLGPAPATTSLDLSRLGLEASQRAKDVWRGEDVPPSQVLRVQLPAHGSVLYTFEPAAK